MNRKKLCLLLASMTMSISVCTVAIFANKNGRNIYAEKAVENRIVLNSSKNKFHNYTGSTAYSGEATAQTNLGNDIDFSYTDLMGLSTTWHVAKTGGGFYNIDPIHGLESISLSFKTNGNEFKLYWSSTTSFTEDDSQSFTSSTSSSTIFNFSDDYPTHFKFVNTSSSNLNVSEVEIGYSCQNNYPTLTISSNNDAYGTVSGNSGIIHSGQNVSISAKAKQGSDFVGWYCGDELVSSDATYNFVMGYEDLNYIARFTPKSYNFIVQTESSAKGTVVDVSGSYDYLTPITVEATANDGYSFKGWYRGSSLVSSSNPYTFNMPYTNTTYTAKFLAKSYKLTLVNENPELGVISSSKSYSYGSSVTIIATPNTGVSFLGWHDENNNLVSSLASFTFNMPHENLTYAAKFAWASYSVNLTINDSSMGSVIGNGSYLYEQEVTLIANPTEHHSFFGWYDGEILLSQESTYVFDMPANSLNYTARFVKNYNLYIYSDDETKGTVSFPSEWGEGLEVTISADNTNYALDYWYDDNLNEVSYDTSYTFIMPNHDLTLYAAFTTGYVLTVTSENTSKGTVAGGGHFVAGRTAIVAMNLVSGIFKGWFDNNNLFLGDDDSISVIMPSHDYSLEARFLTEQEEWDVNHGVVPVVSKDGKTITYGLYPQTNINNPSLISALNELTTPESNGWYLYNGEYYAKERAENWFDSTTFYNGDLIVYDEEYWFKCEPIVWNVLSYDDGEYLLLSSVLLDVAIFNRSKEKRTIGGQIIYPNNYEYSDIRTWLNNSFYASAFALGDSAIQTVLVDNSISTTTTDDTYGYVHICNDTLDKVFLLSYQDYFNDSFGFSTPDTRCSKTTDWARAGGACIFDNEETSGYWTRSPGGLENYTWIVMDSGQMSWQSSDYGRSDPYNCVRPAIKISLSY